MSRPTSSRRARRAHAPGHLAALAAGVGFAAAASLVPFGAAGASAPGDGSGGSAGGTNTSVYTETNQGAGNAVLAYHAKSDGSLVPIGSFPTGGLGTGASAGSQGGVTLADANRVLAVVNGGSNSVSVFFVADSGRPVLLETIPSGGVDPISVTVHGLWLYVLNAGNSTTAASIAGFDLFGGRAVNLPIATQPLNAAASSPEQISFSPDGRHLLVTEKASSTIDVFAVDRSGAAKPAVTTTVAGTAPYGFAFTPSGVAVVSEAAFGGLATFTIDPDGTLTQVSQVADGQLAACWVALTASGHEAFTTNAHSGTVSSYTVSAGGTLTLVNPAVQASPGAGDTDLAVGANSQLYISVQPQIAASAINPGGTLQASTPVVSGLPAGTFGLAATGRIPGSFGS